MRKNHRLSYKKIQLPFKIRKSVLAFGAQAKNTLCFAKGDCAILSPAHPDLNNAADFLAFEKSAKYFLKKRPQIIACDLHPEYQSTKYIHNLRPSCPERSRGTTFLSRAQSRDDLRPIQHHHAHIASCMAENGLKNQKVIGVAFDGTGLGADNTLWGAEFLLCDYRDFKRAAHLREIPLLGGERAILEPWRVAAAWLYLAYKDKFLDLGIEFTKGMNKKKWQVLKGMYSSGFNSPLASSIGRLFDAAAAVILAKHKSNSEAALAMELERCALHLEPFTLHPSPFTTCYNFSIIKGRDDYIIDPTFMFREIVADLKTKEPQEKIAYRFHFTVAGMIRKTCLVLRKDTKINKIVLSGGVFQNTLLLEAVLDLLYKESFQVVTHKKLSCNDSCISLGQAVIAGLRG